jgi:serine/threonine-protein kinase
MLFELLTGKQPFSGDSLATLMYQIANSGHPDIGQLRAGLPACLKGIIDKALAKNADDRYQTGAEFRQALLACAGTETGKP